MKIPVGMAEVIEEYYKYEDILTLIIYIFLVRTGSTLLVQVIHRYNTLM